MTKQEIINYMYENHVQGDFKIEEMAEDLSQPRKGLWIEHDDGWANVYYECSVCKEPFVLIDGTPAENCYNFCPNCGADMRPQFEEPEINPCRGCEDYDWKGGCKSKGGCAKSRGEEDE